MQTDDHRKHSTFSLPDCVDFKLKTPEIIYNNKVWGYEDVFEHVKRGESLVTVFQSLTTRRHSELRLVADR